MNKIKILDLPKASKILITGHVNPDGDALGSGLALKIVLDNLKYDSVISYDFSNKISPEFKYLPIDKIAKKEELQDKYDISFVFDCGDPKRLGTLSELVIKSNSIYVIDHHLDLKFGTHAEVDPSAASTTQVLFRMFRNEKIEVDSEIANCLLTGLITDTGRFQYSNTNEEVFEIASQLVSLGANLVEITESIYGSVPHNALKLQADIIKRIEIDEKNKLSYSYVLQEDYKKHNTSPEDTDFLIDTVRLPSETNVALLLKEQEDGSYKGSLRSRGKIDVQLVASSFGGGGHKAAAGFSSNQNRVEILDKINHEIRSQG